MTTRAPLLPRWVFPALVALCLAVPAHAATITIVNLDAAGEGFNDATAATPVGGNTGTTVGAQRLIVFQQAAALWGAILPSSVTIQVNSYFNPLTCSSTSAVLGSAGATTIFRDFTGAEYAGTWYCKALADKLAGSDLSAGTADIQAQFNSSIGGTGCMDGYTWYYGLDHNEGASQIDLLAVVQHELGHGLGFQTFASGTTGALFGSYPDIFTRYLYDDVNALHWYQETDVQRAASAVNTYHLLWDGPAARFMALQTLSEGRAVLHVNAPRAIAGTMAVGTAAFGPALAHSGVTGDVVLVVDDAAPTGDACSALTNGPAVAGKVALMDRGTCTFSVKVKNAQNAGAIAAIVVDNAAGSPPAGMGGADATITIPSVRVTLADGNTLKSYLASGLNVTLMVDPALYAGADAAGRPMMYSPNPFVSGSSVSHFDVSATPNLLMEPAINTDLTSSVDLTRYVFEDIGWLPRTTGVPITPTTGATLALRPGAPNPFSGSTSIRFEMPAAGTAELGVYDVAGRLVKRLLSGHLPAGSHLTVWDGVDEQGRRVSGGVYFAHLKVDQVLRSNRIVFVGQ
jgi:hypothetical protein